MSKYDKEYQRKYRAEHPDNIWLTKKRYKENNRDKIAALVRARRQRIRDWLISIKLQSGCVDCGFRANHAALEFDHVNGHKERCIATVNSFERARLEVSKCVVRCANCHSIRHWNERHKV